MSRENRVQLTAFYAVGAFVDRVANIPQHYAPEYEQATLDAAHAVAMAFLFAALEHAAPRILEVAA